MKGKKPSYKDRVIVCERLSKIKTKLAIIENTVCDLQNILKKDYWKVDDIKLLAAEKALKHLLELKSKTVGRQT